MFSDPISQLADEKDELPDHLSDDDDDDTKLTHNTKAAVDMATPAKLKKPDPNLSSSAKPKKGAKPGVDGDDEPLNTAQRLEYLH